jgi:copper resistance protein D
MDIPLIATRAVHFAATISLGGVFGFAGFILRDGSPLFRARSRQLAWASLGVVVATAPLWLIFVAQSMRPDTFGATIVSGTAATVLGGTQFGHTLLVRFALVLLLVPCVARMGRDRAMDRAGTSLAIAGAAAIAWQGHAGADLGWDAAIHLAADATHLIAATLWLGALLPLALFLTDNRNATSQFETARRFSSLGVICVAALLVSGLINAWYTVGTIPALIDTAYGQTLLAKLALVAMMLFLAGINRWRLVPLIARDGRGAARSIARHAAIEAGLGLGVIAIVAALGTMRPAVHEQMPDGNAPAAHMHDS